MSEAIRGDRGPNGPRSLIRAYDLLTGDEDARVCKDIPEDACREQPGNFFKHLVSSFFTKLGDSLASAKLVLPWLMATLGAPAYLTGFLVPIRESGALLPQLVVAGYIRPKPVRKWFWVAASVVEGLAVIGMAFVAIGATGQVAGWAIIGLLAVFSLARGVASVTSKDVLGKTISKRRRGTLMGYASAVAGVVTILVGVYLKGFRGEEQPESFFFIVLLAAGILWFLGAALFGTVKEAPGATSGGANAITEAIRSIKIVSKDKTFRKFVITRTLLLSTALSVPFYVVLGNESTGQGLGNLGVLMVAIGIGTSLSAPVWGRLADRSSRLVMVGAAGITALVGLVLFAMVFFESPLMRSEWSFAAFLLVIGMAHGGARLGRKTYLVDMATAKTRSAYVAVSNTIIGIMLLAGGSVGWVASSYGTEYAILVLALVGIAAVAMGLSLREIED